MRAMWAMSAQSHTVTGIRQRGRVIALLAATLLVVGTAWAWAWLSPPIASAMPGPRPVDPLAHLCGDLVTNPTRWVGQALRVRAVAIAVPQWVPAPHSPVLARRMVALLVLVAQGCSLPLVFGPEDRWLSALRRLPVAGPRRRRGGAGPPSTGCRWTPSAVVVAPPMRRCCWIPARRLTAADGPHRRAVARATRLLPMHVLSLLCAGRARRAAVWSIGRAEKGGPT